MTAMTPVVATFLFSCAMSTATFAVHCHSSSHASNMKPRSHNGGNNIDGYNDDEEEDGSDDDDDDSDDDDDYGEYSDDDLAAYESGDSADLIQSDQRDPNNLLL